MKATRCRPLFRCGGAASHFPWARRTTRITAALVFPVVLFLASEQGFAAQGAGDARALAPPADRNDAVEGTVLDEATGLPLADCNVIVEGSTLGTTTDSRGAFTLRLPGTSRAVLVVSRVGYEAQRRHLDLNRPAGPLLVNLRSLVLPSRGVTVTATRAREREAPVAFANLTGEDLEARYFAEDMPVLLGELPSTTFYSDSGNGIGYTYLSIRGFDQRRISVLINGVPQNDPEDHNVYWVDFPDMVESVQDIQVQRGSGMAFYGPPAIGGSVNILTEAPPATRGASVTVGAGAYGTRRYSVKLASGLVASRYLFEARGSRIESDGYRERSWVDFKSYFLSASRVGDRSITRINVYAAPIEDHLAYYGIAKGKTESRSARRENPIARPDEIENFNQPHFEVLHELRPSPNLKITNTIFGVRGYGFFDYDGAWAPMSYYRLTSSYGFDLADSLGDSTYVQSLLIRANVDNRQAGWLPQLTWTGRRVELTAGGEFRAHRSVHWGRVQKGDAGMPAAVSGGYEGLDYIGHRRYYEFRGAKDVLSPYVHAVLRPDPRVNAVFDLQYAHLRYRLYDEEFLGSDFEVPYDFWNPRAGVNVNLTGRWNAFAGYARTSREPRLKNLYDAAEASTPASWAMIVPQFEVDAEGRFDFRRPFVKPERLDDYEAGIGYRVGARSVVVNLYRMDFRDEIINQGRVDRFGQPVTGNAERTRHEGVEVALAGPLGGGFGLSANLMVSRNDLVDYVVYEVDGTAAVPVVLDGNPIAGFPGTLGNLRVSYAHGGAGLWAAAQHVGKQYTDNFRNEANTVDAHTVFHAGATYEFTGRLPLSGLAFQIQVRNVLDTLYNAYGEGEAFFPAAGRQFFVGLRYTL
jgi:iron complex outermembrane receptor protein